jgi:hypothetical protein
MWPLTLPNGRRVHAMRVSSRSRHVRAHLLHPHEKWHEIGSFRASGCEAERAGHRVSFSSRKTRQPTGFTLFFGCGSLSAFELRRARALIEAAGLPCGEDAHDTDAPDSPGHAIALDLFVRDYEPLTSCSLVDAFKTLHPFALRDGDDRRVYVVTLDGLVVVARGPDDLWWRTSYRVLARHRPHGRADSAARRLRWALHFAETLADSGGKNHE